MTIDLKKEFYLTLVTYVLGYIYMRSFTDGSLEILTLFASVFSLTGLRFIRNEYAPKEQWVWFTCMWGCILGLWVGNSTAWDSSYTILFIHGFAIYWIYCRAGKLLDNQTGNYFLIDMFKASVSVPWNSILKFFRIRKFTSYLNNAWNHRVKERGTWGYSFLVVIISFCLLLVSIQLLGQTNDVFQSFFRNFTISIPSFMSDLYDHFILFCFGLPVGSFLYGLINGSIALDQDQLVQTRLFIHEKMNTLRKIPYKTWLFILSIFNGIYSLYMVTSCMTLYSNLTSYTSVESICQHARQGFFQLCLVMMINFLLLWMVHYTSKQYVEDNKTLRLFITILVGLSIGLAIVAIINLGLYMTWGLTAKRLQSSWLICVLTLGCIIYLVWLYRGKNQMSYWFYFSAISLMLLHFI